MTKAPKDASVLIIGDSLTNSTVYPREIYNLFITNDKLELNMIGSHSGGGKIDEKIKHEGRGGWTWASYCSRWSEGEGYKAKSPFLVLKDKKPVIDFPAYYSKYAEGKAPEIITIMLGINDVFRATDSDVEERINNILATAKKFLGEMRKASPESIIGIALITPPAATQTAFGSNYKCKYRRWQFRKNQHRLNEVYQNEFGGREKENIYLIPAYLNIDTRNNFPTRLEPVNARSTKKVRLQSNGVHPARPGYYQIADTFYGWMRYILTKKYEK
jgi:lysophospholipase L1-like esterase